MTIIQQPVVVTTTMVQQYRESPVQTVCPYCQANIVTAVSYDVGTFTWLIVSIIYLVGSVTYMTLNGHRCSYL